MLSSWVRAILQATVYDVAIQTPLENAPKLSKRFDNQIRLKREDLQPVFSFKLRGAALLLAITPKALLIQQIGCN